MSDQSGSVALALINATGATAAYVGEVNTMTLWVVNQTGAEIVVEPGTLENPPPSGGAFGITLSFDAFYTTASDQGLLSITADGWEAEYFADDDWPAWVLMATEEQKWESGQALSFTVAGFAPTQPVGTYYLGVGLYNLPGVAAQPYSIMVSLENQPSAQGKELDEALLLSVDVDTVQITKDPDEQVTNAYQLTLSNRSTTTSVVSPATDLSGVKLTLSFDYADAPGYYALTTTDLAGQIQVSIADDPYGMWNTPRLVDGPAWEITPKSSNTVFLGTGQMGSVTFGISNVVTQLMPGTALLYLQCTG
ncbi:MAG TPA: hypothetical protein VFQ45_21285, partial [Longimicrobium sp.]|nr:hypothetical protein [Longimicrobium sp.]